MLYSKRCWSALILSLACSSESSPDDGVIYPGGANGEGGTTTTNPLTPAPPIAETPAPVGGQPAATPPPVGVPPTPPVGNGGTTQEPPSPPVASPPNPGIGGQGGGAGSTETDDVTTDVEVDVTTDVEVDVTTEETSSTHDTSTADNATPGEGECRVGTTAGNEVVLIGESFIAQSSIPQELANLARANGSLGPGESYIDRSVSGTRLGDGAIPRQYTQAQASNPIRFVLMNGGGNDCLQAGDSNSPIAAAETLYAEMAADGVEKVVYFFYPDAGTPIGGPNSSLQRCLNEYRPKIKAVCDGLTAPKCYWLDLAETSWRGNENAGAYTTDGIHPNATGSRVTAEAIWEVMVENCVAQ